MFLTLDRKLSKSLAEILPQDLEDRLSIKEVEFHPKGLQIKGRQILWMIARDFGCDTDLGFTYSLEDLSVMDYHGDEKLQYLPQQVRSNPEPSRPREDRRSHPSGHVRT